MKNIYRNILFHIPHSSKRVPLWTKSQFVLSPAQMRSELILMTDYKTDALFTFDLRQKKLVAKVSRLVVDVERFAAESAEIMSQVGMGVIYEKTSGLTDLRRKIASAEREKLLRKYYYPHHRRFYSLVKNILAEHGKCLVLDCHSFSSFRQKYEIGSSEMRPEICLGTDNFHTSHRLLDAAHNAFSAQDFEVGLNTPFSGSIVPLEFHEKDERVQSIMIEVRRDLYMNENTGKLTDNWRCAKRKITSACKEICKQF